MIAGFDLWLAIGTLPRLLEGLGVTLALLVVALLLATGLAFPLAGMRMARLPVLSWPARIFINLFRGTPLIVQLFLLYYGVAQFATVRASPIWPLLRDPFACAAIALGLNGAAVTAEILRGALGAVPAGVREAAAALGLRRHVVVLRVSGPIALRVGLPPYGNEIVSMMKATALASTVTVADITGVARTEVSQTLAPYEIFLSAAAIYVVLAMMFQRLVAALERRMELPYRR